MKNTIRSGYSLVELAIVLIIIGLIIGGVLKGRELIQSARLKSVLTQLNEYRVATGSFMDLYNALPGDYSNAKNTISNELINGNGDGVISGEGLLSTSESGQFWAHLNAAGLVALHKGNDGGEINFNKGAPSAKIGGGITVALHNGQHWFVLGAKDGSNGTGALLTPQQAMSLDNQSDNGIPISGRVLAMDGSNVNMNSCVTADGQYNTSHKDRACIMYFKF